MSDITNRERLLELREILERQTDEKTCLSKEDIMKKLDEKLGTSEFKVNTQSLLKDIKALRSSGFDVITEIGKNNKSLYSNKNKLFELYELRILIDAVSSARFITSKETTQIIEKLKKLTGTTLAKKLQNQIRIDGRVKASNNQVRLWIDTLHTAISEQKKVLFKYGNYNMDKEFTLHRNGDYYQVDPYVLIWNNDFYYLVGKLDDELTFRNFRVDRMRNVQLVEKIYKKGSLDVTAYLNEIFNMYPGKSEIVKIQFDKQLINAVLDRFGNEVVIRKIDDSRFEVRFKAAINEGLIRWVLMWGSDAKVIYPISLVDALRLESEKMKEMYVVE